MVIQTAGDEATVQLEAKPKCVSVSLSSLVPVKEQENEPMDNITAAQTAQTADEIVPEQEELEIDDDPYWDADAIPLDGAAGAEGADGADAETQPHTPVFEDWNGPDAVPALQYDVDHSPREDALSPLSGAESPLSSPGVRPVWAVKDALVRLTDEFGNDAASTDLFVVKRYDREQLYLQSVDNPAHEMTRAFEHVIPLNRYGVDDHVRITEADHPHFGKIGQVLHYHPEQRDVTIALDKPAPGDNPTITVPAETSICRMAHG
jgi:hypothetical protein